MNYGSHWISFRLKNDLLHQLVCTRIDKDELGETAAVLVRLWA